MLGRGRGRLPALDAAARLGRAGSRGLVARGRGRARRDCPTGRSGSPARCTASSCSARTARCCGPAILWNDERTGAECAEIEERVGLERLIALTGNRALTGFTAPKLLWLRRHEPDVYARIRHVLLPEGLRPPPAHRRARDRRRRRVGDAALRRRQPPLVARRCCDALEIPLEWLPAAYESTEVAGAGDQAAAALGVGIDRPGPVSVVLGTSGVVFAALPALRARPRGARARLLPRGARDLARDGRDALRGGLVALAARRCSARRSASSTPRPPRWRPGTEGLLFAPYLAGERTPHADPDARGAFTGLSLRHDRGALARAVLEGVAYGLRDSLELLRELGVRARGRPRSPAAARAASSGRGSSRRCSTSRSSAPRPTRAPRSAPRCSPASARASSPTPPRRSPAASASPRRVEPDPAWVEAYAHGYERFRALYPALRPLEGT